MPYNHRGVPTGDNHRPTPRLARMLQAYGMGHDTPFGSYGYWSGQQSSPSSMEMQQGAINQYRRDRGSSSRDARVSAQGKADYIRQAISWNRRNPKEAEKALNTWAPKAVEALGDDPLGRY